MADTREGSVARRRPRVIPRRAAIATVFFATLGTTAYLAGQRWVAEIVAQDAQFQFARWQRHAGLPDAVALNAAESELIAALGHDPTNPHLESALGRLISWRINLESGPPEGLAQRRNEASRHYRAVAQALPTSGHAWIGVAYAYRLLDPGNPAFAAALRQMLRLSPWQPQVQMAGIKLGLSAWQALDADTQQDISRAIQRQAEWKLVDQKPALIALIKAHGQPQLGCPWAGAALDCASR